MKRSGCEPSDRRADDLLGLTLRKNKQELSCSDAAGRGPILEAGPHFKEHAMTLSQIDQDATSAQLKHDIDSGRVGDEVAGFDPEPHR